MNKVVAVILMLVLFGCTKKQPPMPDLGEPGAQDECLAREGFWVWMCKPTRDVKDSSELLPHEYTCECQDWGKDGK